VWVSPLRAAKQAIGLGLAAEQFGAKLFGSARLLPASSRPSSD
jgi:phage portal protein BeeE